MAVTLDQPARVVQLSPLLKRRAQRLDIGEALHPQQLLLERADDPLGITVALGVAHEEGAGLDAQRGELALPIRSAIASNWDRVTMPDQSPSQAIDFRS